MTIVTVSDFLDELSALPPQAGGFYSYRGERDSSWKTSPGLFRSENSKVRRHEKELIRDLMAIHPQEFVADVSMFDRLVRMQHYGLPTRLLDMTRSPLTALYFATADFEKASSQGRVTCIFVPDDRKKYYDSDVVSCLSNLSNLSHDEKVALVQAIKNPKTNMSTKFFNSLPEVDRLLQFIRAEKPYFRPEIDQEDLVSTCYVVPKANNRRLIAQNGAFIIYGLSKKRRGRPGSSKMPPSHITIPYKSKEPLQKELDKLGINASSLYPEIESAARYVASCYR